MHRPHNYHRLANQEYHDQDHEEDDLPPFNITQSTFESSEAKQRNSPALNNDHPPPPLMPLFTPVLQDFQNRFGSSVLQHSSSSNDPLSRDHNHNRNYHDDREDPYDQDEQEEEGGIGNSEYSHQRALSRTNNDSRNDYRQDVGMDASLSSSSSSSSSSRRHQHRAFGGIGVLESNHSLRREGGGGRPLFANSHSPRHDSSGPFFPSSTSGGGRGGNTRISRSHLDIGTDQEAPASLMIEMNQGGHDDDDNNRTYWGLGNRAKKLYKRPGMDAAELAMWKWVNVENLDNFLAKVTIDIICHTALFLESMSIRYETEDSSAFFRLLGVRLLCGQGHVHDSSGAVSQPGVRTH